MSTIEQERKSAVAGVLTTEALAAGYHGHPIIRDINLVVPRGRVVALLGPNGAGKTTTLRAVSGHLAPLEGAVLIDGAPVRAPLHKRARAGMAYVTEERSVFMRLTTEQNLRLGRCDVDRALELFPELRPLLPRTAGLLSGGEQQMLTLARALARAPRYLLVDELSLGLAPIVVERLLSAIRSAAIDDNVGVLLIEQHMRQVLKVADHICVMRRGRIALEGAPSEVTARLAEVEGSYLSSQTSDGRRASAQAERQG
jgi:branched-chain amino acid transport system ATP-binding protein